MKHSQEWECKVPANKVGDRRLPLIISPGSANPLCAPTHWPHCKTDTFFVKYSVFQTVSLTPCSLPVTYGDTTGEFLLLDNFSPLLVLFICLFVYCFVLCFFVQQAE